jgi:hypothetical protein
MRATTDAQMSLSVSSMPLVPVYLVDGPSAESNFFFLRLQVSERGISASAAGLTDESFTFAPSNIDTQVRAPQRQTSHVASLD